MCHRVSVALLASRQHDKLPVYLGPDIQREWRGTQFSKEMFYSFLVMGELARRE